jgi:hypothetical protein
MASENQNQKKHDPHEIEGVGRHRNKTSSFLRCGVIILLLLSLLTALVLSPLSGKIYRKLRHIITSKPSQEEKAGDLAKREKETAPEPEKPKEPEIRPPKDHTVSSGGNIRMLSRGTQLQTKITMEKGVAASVERVTDESYSAHYELKIKLPKAITTLPDLEKNTPGLGSILPGLEVMLADAKVSGFFYQIYENKTQRLKKNAAMLNELMTRHNFYDCETILNMKHPETGQRMLLMQAEMDVVSDGSDGDRLPVMPEEIVNSTNYQPLTSYGWKKTGKSPNPLIKGWKNRIRKAEAEIALPDTKADRKAWLRSRIEKIKREIQDMESRSFLVAEYDPFIVMPINMLVSKGDPYAARVGDYAIVIHEGEVYPSIVGDAGPSFKVGETSLRFCKQINPKAGIYSRPVSDLSVTYIVFPGSRDSSREPDYSAWRTRCLDFISKVGGLGAEHELHSWENTFPGIDN